MCRGRSWTKHGRNLADPWINVSITGCAYRAELILGRYFTYSSYCMRMRVLKYHFIKMRFRYINVPWTLMDTDGSSRAALAR